MKLNNRIYSRKVLWRLVYMFNFVKTVLLKDIYIKTAEKVETIVFSWMNKVSPEEFKKYDFSFLDILVKLPVKDIDISEYLNFFDPSDKKFDEMLAYVLENVKKKDIDELEYDFVVKNMQNLKYKYDEYVGQINKFLPTFKFEELDSVTQSILLLAKTESDTYQTPKAVLIKEADLLADNFSSDSAVKLVHAVLDKIL